MPPALASAACPHRSSRPSTRPDSGRTFAGAFPPPEPLLLKPVPSRFSPSHQKPPSPGPAAGLGTGRAQSGLTGWGLGSPGRPCRPRWGLWLRLSCPRGSRVVPSVSPRGRGGRRQTPAPLLGRGWCLRPRSCRLFPLWGKAGDRDSPPRRLASAKPGPQPALTQQGPVGFSMALRYPGGGVSPLRSRREQAGASLG